MNNVQKFPKETCDNYDPKVKKEMNGISYAAN